MRIEADVSIVCLAERGARGIRSQGCEAPPSAAALWAVLEVEFLSRIIASKQSMKRWGWGLRRRCTGPGQLGCVESCAAPPIRTRVRYPAQITAMSERARNAASAVTTVIARLRQ